MHPFALAPGGHNACLAEVGEVAGDLGLALAQYLNQIADAEFVACHQIEEAQACGVSQRGKQTSQLSGFCGGPHRNIVYALTDMSADNIFA